MIGPHIPTLATPEMNLEKTYTDEKDLCLGDRFEMIDGRRIYKGIKIGTKLNTVDEVNQALNKNKEKLVILYFTTAQCFPSQRIDPDIEELLKE